MAALADKAHDEQSKVAAGELSACGATHPDVAVVCIRGVHVPDDTVHVGDAAGTLIQWEGE